MQAAAPAVIPLIHHSGKARISCCYKLRSMVKGSLTNPAAGQAPTDPMPFVNHEDIVTCLLKFGRSHQSCDPSANDYTSVLYWKFSTTGNPLFFGIRCILNHLSFLSGEWSGRHPR